MRTVTALALALLIAACLMTGCDSGTDTYRIDGDWSLGTVRFIYGGDDTWTLYDVVVTVNTTNSTIDFSGLDRDDLLWWYSGDYSRNGNRVVALDMPEIDYGSEDQLDLRLEFTSSRRFEGVAINWVYDRSDLVDVGAANVSGRKTSIAAAQARDMSTASSDEKTSKLELLGR